MTVLTMDWATYINPITRGLNNQLKIKQPIKNKEYRSSKMKTSKQVKQDRIKLIQENPDKTVAEIAKMANCSRQTIYLLKRELKRKGIKLPTVSRGRKPKEMTVQTKEEPNTTGGKIYRKCVELSRLLISKNQNYGNSALTAPPLADVSIQTGILVRLGDKFKRLQQLTHGEQDKVGESLKDTIQDIAGYCILYLVSEEPEKGVE